LKFMLNSKICPENWLILKKKQHTSDFKKNLYIYYTFYFNTLITPYKINNIRLFLHNSSSFKSKKLNKLYIKQSYLLLTWFWYIKKKHNLNNKVQPSFVYKPTKKYRLTFLKAPMAHKTFSQEQVKLQYFVLTITFKILLPSQLINNMFNFNKILYLILNLRQNIPFIETNLFLLRRFKLSICFYEDTLWKILF
jgi:hypothetical protein